MSVKRLFETFKPENYKIFLDLSGAKNRIFRGKLRFWGELKNRAISASFERFGDFEGGAFAGESLKFEHREEDELVIFVAKNRSKLAKNITLEIEFSGKKSLTRCTDFTPVITTKMAKKGTFRDAIRKPSRARSFSVC